MRKCLQADKYLIRLKDELLQDWYHLCKLISRSVAGIERRLRDASRDNDYEP